MKVFKRIELANIEVLTHNVIELEMTLTLQLMFASVYVKIFSLVCVHNNNKFITS